MCWKWLRRAGFWKKVGTLSVDGTKIHANASKHSAVSYARAQEMLEQLQSEVARLDREGGAVRRLRKAGLRLPFARRDLPAVKRAKPVSKKPSR